MGHPEDVTDICPAGICGLNRISPSPQPYLVVRAHLYNHLHFAVYRVHVDRWMIVAPRNKANTAKLDGTHAPSMSGIPNRPAAVLRGQRNGWQRRQVAPQIETHGSSLEARV